MSVFSSEETVSGDSLLPPGDSKLDAGLAQIDACNFDTHPMLVYTIDDNIPSCSAVCCVECAETENLDACCKPKRKRPCCPKPCPKPCPRPRRRCKPKVCCKPRPACKRKPKKCCKPRKKPCCPKRKPRCCPKRS
ncbi:sperm mitochondrial-associated cysteine-rich protein [Drosophila montana]|uniref:sperm mitochondrial-associated cysteine-rich protein n=1 Tax=Drosophila montana TaxID=40370 RepID=UPI00313B7595